MSSLIAEVERVLRESGPMSVLDLTIELDAVGLGTAAMEARVTGALRSLSARQRVESVNGKWQIRRTPLAQVLPALTERQRAVLEAVKKWGPIGQTKLAEVTAIPAGSIYAIAAALGGLGLIRQVEGKWVSADDAPIAPPDDAPIAPPIATPDDVEDPTEPPSAGGWAAGEPDHVSDGDVVEVPMAEVDTFVPMPEFEAGDLAVAEAVAVEAPDPVRNDQWVARPRRGPDELGRWYWEARATFERRVARGLGWLAPAAVPDALRGLKQTEVLADPLIGLLADIGAVMSGTELTPDRIIALLSADSGARDALLLRIRSLRAAEQDVKQIILRARGPNWPTLHELDVDRAEEAIAAIERKAASWRKVLEAARELRDPQALHGSEAPHAG